jgi:O-antigen biosynthesis protein
MTLFRASLIIVSRHRAAALMRALAAVAQMDHPDFEVIIVTDPATATAIRAGGMRVKLAEFDKANISAARNIGLQMASAPIVAFLDDDAVPEPSWLSRIVTPFETPQVTAAGGFVLGRSGLAWQWRAMWVDGDGFDHPFSAPASVSLHPGTAARAIKTQGTNCAFRRDSLLSIGGFDEGFAFYLDEADVNLRLATLGGLTAVVPNAVVHHGFAASSRRRADRTPTDLFQIGNSLARFTRRHGLTADALPRHIAQQRARLIRHMISGALEPDAVRRLMVGLLDGIKTGQAADITAPTAPISASRQSFLALPNTGPRGGRLISGPKTQQRELVQHAQAARAKGEIVTLILLSRGMRPHSHLFTNDGFWLQTGGRFGRAFRLGARYTFAPAPARLAAEAKRLSAFRPISLL